MLETLNAHAHPQATAERARLVSSAAAGGMKENENGRMTMTDSKLFTIEDESSTVYLAAAQPQPAADINDETDAAARLALNLVLGFAAGPGASWEE